MTPLPETASAVRLRPNGAVMRSLSTVASTEYYALSSLTNTDGSALADGETLIEIDSFTLTYNNQPYPLNDMTQQWVDREQSPSSLYTGQPWGYAIYADQIRLHPIPDQVYACTISGLAQLGTLANDNASSAWMTDGEALIRQRVKAMIYSNVIRDPELANEARGIEREELAALVSATTLKKATGRILPTTF